MPLSFYSVLIAAIVTILGLLVLQYVGFEMDGVRGAVFGGVSFAIVDLLLRLILAS